MAQNIKGITLEIGATTDKFKKAMKDMSSATRATQNELNAVNRQLKFDPKNVDLLKQKEELLAKQIEDVRLKVEKMKEAKAKADKEMANGTEINQENYRQLVREISVAEGQLKSLVKESDKFGNSAKEIGNKMQDVGKKATVVSGAIIGIGTAAVGAMSAAAEETREYREDINKLETAFKTGGFTVDAAKKSYEDFYTVLGETDRSVEAVNHLARFVTTEQDLAKWSDIAAGVTATFGDSLPIEGLTEAANETAKVGQVMGVLADALNWASISEDEFNEMLAKCSSEQERSELITNTLNGAYKESAEIYKELNADIIANRRAASEANDQMAELGKSSEGVNTKLKEAKNTVMAAVLPTIGKFADKVSELDEDQVKLIGGIGAGLLIVPQVISGIGGVVTAIGTVSNALAVANTALLATPVGAFVAAAGLCIGAFAALDAAATAETRALYKKHEARLQELEDYEKARDAARETAVETANSELAQMEYLESLKDELMENADANGKVEDSYRSRAQFILGQLNSALGTEYEMTDGQIKKYGELCDSIEEVTKQRQLDAIIAASEASRNEATANIAAQKKAMDEATAAYEEAEKKFNELNEKVQAGYAAFSADAAVAQEEMLQAQDEMIKTTEIYAESSKAIKSHESMLQKIGEGDADEVIYLWKNRAGMVDEATRDMAAAYAGAIVDLANYAENYARGIDGYTQEGLTELQTHVAEMKGEAEKLGVALNEGIVKGVEGQEIQVHTAISKLCGAIPQWAKDILGINSPAKVAIPIGEAIPQGVAVGIENDMSAEEALEKKCKNLQNILKEYTDDFEINVKLAENEYDLWLSENPNASNAEKAIKEQELLNTKLTEQENIVKAINDTLWYQGELTGENSAEYKDLLNSLREEQLVYNEILAEIEKAEALKDSPKFSETAYDLAESEYNLFLAQNPDATEKEKLAEQEKMLNKQYDEQGKKVQYLNDALWYQIQLTGEESEESKELLIQLNEEKMAYIELASAIEEVNMQKSQTIGIGSSGASSAASKYASYHVQYGALLKSQGVSDADIDAAARKVSGYGGERSINVNNYISGTTPDTAYKVAQETEKTANNLAMQGVL